MAMTKLEELIKEFCPSGVKYINLGEVTDIHKGIQFNKKEMAKEGSYPVINGGIEPSGYVEVYNERENTITISQGGASAGYVNWLQTKFWAGAHCYVVRPIDEKVLDNRYLFHFVKSKEKEFMQSQYGAGIPALGKNTLQATQIPLPPLAVQREIVRILDKFTLYSQELAAELAARKKQYEFYRDELLNFSDRKDIKFLPVSELFEFKNGLNKGKEFFGKGIPIVNFTDVFKNRWLTKEILKGCVTLSPAEIERYSAKKGDVFFTRTSETQEEIGMTSVLLEDIENCVFSGFVLRARPKTKLLLPKFCSYYFSAAHIRKQIIQNSTFTTRALTSGPKLSKILVPILSFEEQLRITTILDNFHSLVTDISEGLPAEIEARQKQYEYYKNKLLRF